MLLLTAVCVLAVLMFLLAYQYDNKYTVRQPQAVQGVLTLSNETLAAYPVLFLVSGWEYHGGELLSPEDFAKPLPPEYIFLGQYGSFASAERGASPHGSATYRLNIIIPSEPREYLLELPEIFSAYRLYINGKEAMQMGDPDHATYRPETGNRTVTFEASERIEIILAVSDFSHLYSGLTYPPAFGDPEQVTSLLNTRLIIRAAVCALALGVALLSLLIGLVGRSGKLTLLYSLLCICFTGYVSYPLIHSFARGYWPFYVIESVSFCAMLLLIMYIQYSNSGQKDAWSRYFLGFALLSTVAAAVLPLGAFFHSAAVMQAYSWLISAYEIIAAGYLTFMAVRAIIKKTASGLAFLGGILVLNCALVMDRVLPLYEPIRTGWFIEMASFVLVLAIGAVIGQEIASKYRESAVLNERTSSMERLAEMQLGYVAVLKQEMEETRVARHDLRHHFAVMKGFLQGKQYEELAEYITEYHGPASKDAPTICTENDVINILLHHYATICEQNHISFEVRCTQTASLSISGADLCGVLSNLLENAVEACLRIEAEPRVIRLSIMDIGDLAIRVENSTDSKLKKSDDSFFSSKGEDRVGYGLASVRAIAKRYNGTTNFIWDSEEHLFISTVSLRQQM